MEDKVGAFSGEELTSKTEEGLKTHYRELWNKIDEIQSESDIRRIQGELKVSRNIFVKEHGWSRAEANELVGQNQKLEFPEVK